MHLSYIRLIITIFDVIWCLILLFCFLDIPHGVFIACVFCESHSGQINLCLIAGIFEALFEGGLLQRIFLLFLPYAWKQLKPEPLENKILVFWLLTDNVNSGPQIPEWVCLCYKFSRENFLPRYPAQWSR